MFLNRIKELKHRAYAQIKTLPLIGILPCKNVVIEKINIEEVFKKVRIEVSGESDGRQIPWENNSLTGDFFFIHP